MVRKGVSHLGNVTVLSSGPYAVSLTTFPSYFSAEDISHAKAGASIDATIYAKHIAKTLGVKTRYVGTEPYSPVTAVYNATMQTVFREYNMEITEIPLLEVDGKAVSASLVREALRIDDLGLLAKLVPESTYSFLISESASGIVSALKKTRSRH